MAESIITISDSSKGSHWSSICDRSEPESNNKFKVNE
jgi:hypothetical protein